jgi:hypothetical protein
VADLVLSRCLNGFTQLDIESVQNGSNLKAEDIRLQVIFIPEGYHEFLGKGVAAVGSARNDRSLLACLVVSAAVAYCFDGTFDLDNWIRRSTAEPVKILSECLRHEGAEAAWLLDRLNDVA